MDFEYLDPTKTLENSPYFTQKTDPSSLDAIWGFDFESAGISNLEQLLREANREKYNDLPKTVDYYIGIDFLPISMLGLVTSVVEGIDETLKKGGYILLIQEDIFINKSVKAILETGKNGEISILENYGKTKSIGLEGLIYNNGHQKTVLWPSFILYSRA